MHLTKHYRTALYLPAGQGRRDTAEQGRRDTAGQGSIDIGPADGSHNA